MGKSVIIKAPSRLHIGLTNLSRVSTRIYGGLGLSINAFETVWAFEESRKFEVIGLEKLENRTKNTVYEICNSLGLNVESHVNVSLLSHPPEHVGLGSKTALLLALIQGINLFFELGLSRQEMNKISGRGGTSGIGVSAFWLGGIIWDIGHKTESIGVMSPSSSRKSFDQPFSMGSWNFPNDWRIALMLPRNLSKFSDDREVDFFEMNSPISVEETFETSFSQLSEILPGFCSSDLSLVSSGLRRLHSTGFKKRELLAQPKECLKMYQHLAYELNLAVGLSSLGPLLFVFTGEDSQKEISAIKSLCEKLDFNYSGQFKANNTGHKFEVGS